MSPDDPRHGTTRGYSAHQSDKEQPCQPCNRAKLDYDNHANRQRAYGRWNPWAPAEPVREHIRQLMDEGTSVRRIAQAIGYEHSRVGYVLYGRGSKKPPTKIRPDFAAAVLGFRGDRIQIPIVGAQRRLAALIALGYTQPWIADQIGCTQGRIWGYLNGVHATVSVDRFEAISAVYEAHSMKLPPERNKAERYAASRARNTARRNGFLPPLAWENIDDPDERPSIRADRYQSRTEIDHAVVERILAGADLPTSPAEKVEVTRRWLARGGSLNELERRTGWRSGRHGKVGAA